MICKCGVTIPQERVEFGLKTCIDCSDVKPKKGLMSYAHKTAGSIILIPDNPEAERQAFRAYRRER